MWKFIYLFVCGSLYIGGVQLRSTNNSPKGTFLNDRVVGGELADQGEYPSQLSLQFLEAPFCAATIISDRYALTAAHCLAVDIPEVFSVRAGSVNVYEGTLYQVVRLIVHENYNASNAENDIAIIEVTAPFTFSPDIQPSLLPTEGDKEPAVGAQATLIGWGDTEYGGPSSYLLLEAQIEIRNQTLCEEAYESLGNTIFPSQICADGPAGGIGACYVMTFA